MDFRPYAAWQQALEDAFFSSDWDGHPVVMYVDDAEAANLRARYGLDASLVDAVRQVVRPEHPKPYEVINQYEQAKRHSDQAPAVLPLLACSVMAATRMANDGQRRASNYHDQFSQLLTGRDGVLTSQNYLPIAGMWQRLASWQTQWGAYRGLCTIPSPEDLPSNQARIGYALSQAVLRGTDRQLLPRFFHLVRQRNEVAWPLPGATLLFWLERLPQEDKFSPGLRRAIADPEFRPIVERLLGNLANVWDGSPEFVQQGTPRAELLVRFENRKLGWLARLPRQGAEEYALPDGVMLRRLGDTEFYRVDGLKLPDAQSLRHGIQLRGAGVAVSRPASSLVVLRQNAFLDCLTSVDRFVPGEDHMILAAPEAEHDVEAVLERAASPGRRKDAGRLSWMPDGWSLHHRVIFNDAVTLRQAIRDIQGALLAMEPAPQYKPYLEGGLPIAPKLSKHLYLAGGEPDLVLPDGATGGARLDGRLPEPPFPTWGVPVQLWERGLSVGTHVIDIEGTRVEFAIAEGAPDIVEPDAIAGFPRAGDRAQAFATTGLLADELVRGALAATTATTTPPRVALCRRGAEKNIFVSADGRAWVVAEPGTPSWWSRLTATPSGYYFEVELRGPGGWVLQRRKGIWQIAAMYPTEPDFRPGPQHRGWAAAVLDAAHACHDPLWKAYVRLAEEVER
ncbi:hypothetical protein GBF35_46170 [Nonomuraea phyllanthi]|uniref:hypothetical protein n=1 Tax=Nonomuraea phyllanthi TaxID=2219224 RepID=UPI0012934AD0|nr:hypothetical protein [Nonomuraea phyllanthi]QFY12969.1 hypothetical protein GBF35_46170 [Nonomuraea phyllanthi]